MAKIIDLKQATINKESKTHTLEHFIQTEFTRDNADLSVKIDKYKGGIVSARVIKGKGWNAQDVIEINFDDDIDNVKVESMEVLDRLYQYLAIRVAEKYESLLGKNEVVKIFIN